MKATVRNVQRVMQFIIDSHEDNMRGGEFDDETNLKAAVKSVIKQLKDEPTFCCSNCGGGFNRDEMVFDEDNENDFCTDCAK
jgi:lipopolysaccharide biosynthesis regulator YciM